MKHIDESIIGRKGNTGKGLKGVLREFDIVTSRDTNETAGVYMVIFDERIIEKFTPRRMNEARPGLFLAPDCVYMFLSNYTDDLLLNQLFYSPYDIVEIYRNPDIDSNIFKKDILSGKFDLDNFDINRMKKNFYKKIWERK